VHCIVCPSTLCAGPDDFQRYLLDVLPTLPALEAMDEPWRQVFAPTVEFFKGFDAVVLVSAWGPGC
jgi:hypothetical protein